MLFTNRLYPIYKELTTRKLIILARRRESKDKKFSNTKAKPKLKPILKKIVRNKTFSNKYTVSYYSIIYTWLI